MARVLEVRGEKAIKCPKYGCWIIRTKLAIVPVNVTGVIP
jgi:hypothetical protein